eukprot:PITA_15286
MTEFVEIEPSSFKEAIKKPVWVDAMVEEYESMVKNNVWKVVPRSVDKSIVGLRWIFKVKHGTNGSIEKYKAIFVSKGYFQVEGIEYEESFSPVARSLSFKEDLAREFELKDMGFMHYFIGLEVWQGDGDLFVSQGKYANKIFQGFCMDSCKPMEAPLETNLRKEDATSGEEVDATIHWKLVGSLMYLLNR